jgi:catechol 2,3-dioxygenase-like lactoylglutathione lyase family enzyme
MISGVGSVAVLSRDPRKLARWYSEKLGFEILGEAGHTIYVRPKGAQNVLLHICGKCDSWENDKPRGRTGIWLHCGKVSMNRDAKTGQLLPFSDPSEAEKTFMELKRSGVEFSEELTTTDWGKYAIMRDPEGNEFEIG